jgi:excisionase family DNA binding protein
MATQMMTYQQAAELLQLPIGTVYAMVSHHRIPHVRLGAAPRPLLPRRDHEVARGPPRRRVAAAQRGEAMTARVDRGAAAVRARRGAFVDSSAREP